MIFQSKIFQTISKISLALVFIAGAFHLNYAQELNAYEIIQKNIDARGGADAWAKVNTIKMTGTYVNFSIPEDFTIYRMRPDLYKFETTRLHQPSIHVYDGKQAWWINPIIDPKFSEPSVIPSANNLDKVTLRERFFEPVYWNYKEKGNHITLIGKEKVDGEETYKLKIKLKDGSEEIWFFSAETFLPVMMQGTTYDFGVPNKLEMFFSDYRKVGDIVMPYLVESEYGIRYRSLEIDNIEINNGVNKTIFEMKK